MAVTPTFPGVYIEEIPSGVRTITGVSTSVTAFLGPAKRGPINRAVHLLSYSDFERKFGGLASDSEMSYSVRAFFLNGGSDAWVVRLAGSASPASRLLQNSTPADIIQLTALDDGLSGNSIELRVDYKTGNPASTFNLTASYISPDNPADNITETYSNLSMNKSSPRFVETVINGASNLLKAERVATQTMLDALGSGTSLSGDLTSSGSLVDVNTLVDPTHDQFKISVNGSAPVTVQITPADLGSGSNAAKLAALCTAIANKVTANSGSNPVLAGFTCASSGNRILMTSGVAGENSSVNVLAGARNDLAGRLKLGALNGGVETEAAAALRPVEMPDHGSLTSDTFGATDLDTLPDASHTSFLISLDGYGPDPVSIGDTATAGGNLADKLADVADRIQTAVRAIKPSNPAYRDFTATVAGGNTLVLSSGTRGVGSSVVVNAASSNSIANELHLLTGTAISLPNNVFLQGGSETAITSANQYNAYIGDRSSRKGIYALEAVDLFNILCLTGVSDAGILMDADSYCQERRAFMIVDAPASVTIPDQMVTTATGTSLPKSDHAAVYYPWISMADPLNGGRTRNTAPSGAVAGLYARTDSTRGVWKAPAGTEATLSGAQGVVYPLTNPENGSLNPLGVNCIRSFPVYGTVVWGARTLRGADQMTSEYKYVPVRRLALFIEESLYRGTQWVVFEPNDEPLWSQIRLNVGAFMQNLFRQGAFQGSTPREAYFVKCDGETTTQNDINLGIVNILVGFAPLKPAEFVIIKLQQMAGQVEA
jgi:phage tail sheath protein FI